MYLSELARSLHNGRVIYEGENYEREIEALFVDSRKETKNGLFFCLSGGEQDAHAYAEEAIERGAVALVTQRALPLSVPQLVVADTREALGVLSGTFYGNPTERLKVIGITGTNGKTTTSYMLESILKESGKRVGVIGTLGIRYGKKEKASTLTTPDPIELQEAFAQMLAEGVEYVVMEVSAHALHYKKTAGVRFCACIFTNLSQDHLDFFSSMSVYEKTKRTLFEESVCPVAVVNGDDEAGRRIETTRKGKIVLYGLNTPVDAFAILTDESLRRTECMLNVNDKLCRVSLSFSGRHNVYNALAAATCAMELGVSSECVSRGLTKLKGVKGRLEWIASVRGAEIYVDFAHTPDGLKKAIETLKAHCRGRLICLFGCGGNRDREKRALMGEIAAQKGDFAVLTSDNPRFEDPLDIIVEIERGYRRFSTRYVIVPDRERAIEYAVGLLRKGDVLLVAGKGGETYQEIMGIKYPFVDQDKIIQYLQQKGKNA